MGTSNTRAFLGWVMPAAMLVICVLGPGCSSSPYFPSSLEGRPATELVQVLNYQTPEGSLCEIDGQKTGTFTGQVLIVAPGAHDYRFKMTVRHVETTPGEINTPIAKEGPVSIYWWTRYSTIRVEAKAGQSVRFIRRSTGEKPSLDDFFEAKVSGQTPSP